MSSRVVDRFVEESATWEAVNVFGESMERAGGATKEAIQVLALKLEEIFDEADESIREAEKSVEGLEGNKNAR